MKQVKDFKNQQFKNGVLKRIRDRKWGLQEIDYLSEHKNEYNLNVEDLGHMLAEAYRVAYDDARADGVITFEESVHLLKIKNMMGTIKTPTNRFELNHMREQVIKVSNHKLKNSSQPPIQEESFKQELKGIRSFPKLRLRPPGSMYDPFDLY